MRAATATQRETLLGGRELGILPPHLQAGTPQMTSWQGQRLMGGLMTILIHGLYRLTTLKERSSSRTRQSQASRLSYAQGPCVMAIEDYKLERAVEGLATLGIHNFQDR